MALTPKEFRISNHLELEDKLIFKWRSLFTLANISIAS